MDYYGIDVHKRYSVFTCLDERGWVVRRGRVANTAEELGRAVAPSGWSCGRCRGIPDRHLRILDTLEADIKGTTAEAMREARGAPGPEASGDSLFRSYDERRG